MIPSIQDRLASIVSAMRDVVIPAIDQTNALAHEQAQLIVGHVNLLLQQLDHAKEYEEIEARAATFLGQALLAISSGGPETEAAKTILAKAIQNERSDLDRRRARVSVNDACSRLIDAGYVDGEESFTSRIMPVVLEHMTSTSIHERAFCKAAGFDPDPESLPGLSDAIAAYAATVRR